MKKRVISFFPVLWMIVASVFPVLGYAAQQSRIIQNVQMEEMVLTLLCANGEDTGEYEVQLDGESVPVSEKSVSSSQMPVTVFCLVDTSGSISSFKMKLLQETLTEISASLRADDNMVLATIDNQLSIGKVLSSAQAREEAIAGIQSSHKDTNLYYGIVKSLEQLSSDENYNPCRCLIVLSDGMDFQDNGLTEQEVASSVEKARLPVYTIGLVENYNERDGAKVLGSFARNSYGGLHQATVDEGANKPIRWDASGVEFGEIIWDSLMKTAVLKADLSAWTVQPEETVLRLRVQYRAGSNVYEDSVDLPADWFPVAQPETEATTQPTTQATTEPTVTETTKPAGPIIGKENGTFLWVILAVAAALTLVIGIITARKVSGKKTEKKEEQSRDLQTAADTQVKPDKEEKKIPHRQERKEHRAPCYRVYMTDIPYGRQKLSYRIPENSATSFGRDSRSEIIVNPKDSSLSGKHFSIYAQKRMYYVRDEGSTNGTFLNGVPITGKNWSKLQSGDKLRAGGYEYRIIIEAEED